MEDKLYQIIKIKLDTLVDSILQKNPTADKGLIKHKINTLFNFLPEIKEKVKNKPCLLKDDKHKTTILDTINEQKSTIKIKRTIFSNHILIMDETSNNFNDINTSKFVFDMDNKTIKGVENSKGEIEPLNKSHIEICHKYKLRYEIPLNLNVDDNFEEDVTITNEIRDLGLSYANSEEEDEDKEE